MSGRDRADPQAGAEHEGIAGQRIGEHPAGTPPDLDLAHRCDQVEVPRRLTHRAAATVQGLQPPFAGAGSRVRTCAGTSSAVRTGSRACPDGKYGGTGHVRGLCRSGTTAGAPRANAR